MYSIFIVARVRVWREGITALFASNGKFVVCGSATRISAVLETDATALVVDCSATPPRVLEQYCLSRGTHPPIIAFGVPDNMNAALALLEAGVAAYVGDDCTCDELYETVLDVIEGRARVPVAVVNALLDRRRQELDAIHADTFHSLTPRELEVAELMGNHNSNSEIASELGISVHTVKIHAHNVMQKLQINHRSQTRETLNAVGLG
ncbi:response regulator transcription factor [Nocardioides sp. GCM10028917]|uniref:response regulator transcription factor n=1 Tax=Nocardioides sp. GCM10028917 TaxID=3273408 RepID=UPI0036241042